MTTMIEKNIVHQNGDFWVCKKNGQYLVMIPKLTHSESESAYSGNTDGLSIAIARCDYLAKTRNEVHL